MGLHRHGHVSQWRTHRTDATEVSSEVSGQVTRALSRTVSTAVSPKRFGGQGLSSYAHRQPSNRSCALGCVRARQPSDDWPRPARTNLGGAVQERRQLAYSCGGRPIVVALAPGSSDTFGRCRPANGALVTVDCLLFVSTRSLRVISLNLL